MADNQWRRNPFTGDTYPVSLSEVHTVKFFTDWNAYGIQLDESIYLENPSSVSIVENVTGGTTFTEIPRTSNPSAGQFRVDYEAQTYTGTSRIQFNPSDNGTVVLVEYKGLGILNKVENYASFLAGETIPGDLTVQGLLTVDDLVVNNSLSVGDGSTGSGDVTITGIFTGNTTGALEIDPNAGTIKSLADGVNPSDAATVGQVQDASSITIGATGTHAPAGTEIKMAWFEGTTDGSGSATVAHGLGSNIVMVLGAANSTSSNYVVVFYGNLLGTDISGLIRYDNTNITYTNATINSGQNVRFLVWYKG